MKHVLFGVKIDDFSAEQIDERVRSWFEGEDSHTIVTTNGEFLLQARKDPSFAGLLNRADLSVADSVSIRFAVAALTDSLLSFRHPGVDLLVRLIAIAQEKNKKILFIGGDPGSADAAADKFQKQFPGLNVIAHDPGIIPNNLEQIQVPNKTRQIIQEKKPELVVVALGQGKQEVFMEKLSAISNCKVLIGVGGALEMHGGQKKRGPEWMHRSGLEWLWRVLIEPSRLRRIANATIVFPIIVAREAARNQSFFKACRRVFPEVLKQIKGV